MITAYKKKDYAFHRESSVLLAFFTESSPAFLSIYLNSFIMLCSETDKIGFFATIKISYPGKMLSD